MKTDKELITDLVTALEQIKKRMEIVAGTTYRSSTLWKMVNEALEDYKNTAKGE